MITSKKRIRQRKAAILENKFQLLSLRELQESVLKSGKAILLVPLPICDPT